jgi:hypothetical protein
MSTETKSASEPQALTEGLDDPKTFLRQCELWCTWLSSKEAIAEYPFACHLHHRTGLVVGAFNTALKQIAVKREAAQFAKDASIVTLEEYRKVETALNEDEKTFPSLSVMDMSVATELRITAFQFRCFWLFVAMTFVCNNENEVKIKTAALIKRQAPYEKSLVRVPFHPADYYFTDAILKRREKGTYQTVEKALQVAKEMLENRNELKGLFKIVSEERCIKYCPEEVAWRLMYGWNALLQRKKFHHIGSNIVFSMGTAEVYVRPIEDKEVWRFFVCVCVCVCICACVGVHRVASTCDLGRQAVEACPARD